MFDRPSQIAACFIIYFALLFLWKGPWLQSSTFFPSFGFYKGRTSHIGLFDERKIMHIFYIIIGLKIIKWTVCTYWVHTKITTQSVQRKHWAWPATGRCMNSWVLDAYWLRRMLCVVHFWTHFMRADCSFDYFLPIYEQIACDNSIQKYQRAYSKASKCPMCENPHDICMWR